MEVQDRSRSPSRRTSRVEQVVGRWLRRSRDLGSRSHSLNRSAECSGFDQRNYPFRFIVQIQRDPNLNSHGLTLSAQTPILVQEVNPGGPADGRLLPGDQLVKINNIAVDDLTPEQAAEIIRECQDSLTMTVLRTMLGPKSSFITPEKRAKLRSNPVKVHFAEEVEVNGHSQGNSLLFLPNVLKVYLENGQTKAFKFDPSTTVKDIVMTLKEKLSLSRIEHFSLVLEQRHSISKLLLLHEEERIQQVVQKKEAHDFRCLFRVCFMPRTLQTLLQEDPTSFEYLYLQGVNDVLQERFAIEMRCNSALRLAALHIQERLASCGQSTKTNLKTITKTWGIENFVSSTLLRNMREKDLRKAIGYHMKKSQSLNDPKQKGLSVDQTRVNYLEELSELKSFGGKSFSATMMLQDRESMVTLLVGARYGVSQVVNHKLSILSTLTEFSSITRIELLPESDKVSLVKIYLQDIKKPITLLLESTAAKDMSCLIGGYCRVFVDPNLNVFPWMHNSKKHRVSAEEGYVSRCGSDSDTSSDLDMEALVNLVSCDERPGHRVRSSSDPEGRKRKDRNRRRNKDGKETGAKPWEDKKQKEEASDSWNNDPRVIASPSCDSLDALEEDDLISCSSSSFHSGAPSQIHSHSPVQLHPYSQWHVQPHLLAPPPAHVHPLVHLKSQERSVDTEASLKEQPTSPSSNIDFVFNFDQSDSRCYYKLCSNITPDSARSLPHPLNHQQEEHRGEGEEESVKAVDLDPIPILQPPPGFGDSSSDEEFFDAIDRFTSPEDSTSGATPRDIRTEMKLDLLSTLSLSDIRVSVTDADKDGKEEEDRKLRKRSRKRRSFVETDYTSRVSYPELHKNLMEEENDAHALSSDPEPSEQTQNPSPTVSSLTHSEGEPAQLESKPIILGSPEQTRDPLATSRTRKQEMEMEPDAMEFKSVTDLAKASSPTITVVRCRVDPDGKESADRRESTEEERKGKEEKKEGLRGNSSNSKRPIIGAERQLEANTPPSCLMDATKKRSNGLLEPHLIAHEQNLDEEGQTLEGVHEKFNPPSYSPQPPPPSSPLPTMPVLHKSQSDCYLRGEVSGENLGMKMSSSYPEEIPERHSDKAQLYLDIRASIIEDDANGVASSTRTVGDEVTDSTNSDNVFSDDDMSNSLISSSSDKKDEWATAGRRSISSATRSDDDSQMEGTASESAESDDSDTTVTGSEVDGEFFVEINSAKSFQALSEVKELCPPLPVQTDPKPQPQHRHPPLNTGPIKDSPGPITEPPATTVNGLQRDPSGLKMDTPGPIKEAPESKMTVTSPVKHRNCTSVLASGCESVVEEVQVPLEACGCPTVYTNCFGSGDSFDEELTVYEFSCRAQSSAVAQTSSAAVLPLVNSPPLSPLLSPLSDPSDRLLPQTHKDNIGRLGQQRYPEPPKGFQVLRIDVDQLLSILESGADRSVAGPGCRHPRDSCPAHFTENKRVLQLEARRLMSGCQKVVGIGQSPEEMLHSLADSFRTLVELAGICLWFSGCERCDRRNAEAVAGLADVARSFRDFCLAAERASSKRSCQDLSSKLLAKQCTALTASVFCLTQLFRTLTAL
uniref:FERM and PDZ domain containing 1b n=1 Tax=Gasterosteus aculeatus TaxID=69293 RepID=G3Q3K2_GASAC